MTADDAPWRASSPGFMVGPGALAGTALSFALLLIRRAPSPADSEYMTSDGRDARATNLCHKTTVYFAAWATVLLFPLACSLSAADLSVASQVKSGSLRPKWPYAAVLR